ncbi:disease resistance protein RPP13-like [Actinidia eriantha]|uniref:disease resistance protein RPP13-like n=1 Tax=Actinidia eriantha TaxID=165200 RepID=UPI0025865C22|nr:disease resistance protein RPP13-like [Actinidia eriantha]XP_057502312.1 disease resistance protein RPP13-like [Actinidia eriantha]XP_057502313.1 disease resistance protein RPP13-like [Actinidia eriantha]XP_057502314.1 disease resistance protein RPP13-like [Actinidia eriantha]XP_057502315.1 disease resistance protein RPP13-like [Actinidia eriantha]XP_057502316.1 disease resistance protein RPP13-like [Actinidia eriantha]XP_057502317.1 disease resistance protein RPP13-like [Actinidia erianth
MVDAVVSFVVRRLGDLLIEQVIFQRGVRDEVQWLRNKLKYMLCFLKDAEEKQDKDYRIQMWISDIRDVAYDIEDIIDNFILEVEEGRTTKKMGLNGWFEKYLCICSKQATLYGIGIKINSLKNRLEEIQRNQEIFKIENIGDSREDLSCGRLNQQRRERPYKDNELVVGFKNDVALLMSKLIKEDPHRWVVSIVGMGGLGKTTIARKLYNTSSLIEQFDFDAWVSVSKDYNIQDLLRRTIKSFKKPATKEEFDMLEKMKEEDLESYLRDLLKELRYLVVFDDVWDVEAWESLRRALPDNKNGSRVIITTRQKVVAEHLNERTYVYELPFLGEVESWELFCKKVLPNCNEVDDKISRIPQDLESMAREMVKKCHGLPLAIIVLGGLLSRKHPEEWPKVQKHMWRHVREDNVHVQHILALSFHDLPHHLKCCFLYLGLFPEDFEINANKLYPLWVAEGFINLDKESEEIATEYLKELCDRSMLQVVRKKWRRIISCRIHDILRDFAIEKSKELNFLQFFDGALVSKSRRLAIPCGLQRFVSLDHSNLCLRTFQVFKLENESAEIDQLVLICKKLRLLRVLNLWNLPLNPSQGREQNRLAEAIGKLIHLRYLGLNRIQIDDISPFIGNLQALQTLELKGDYDNPILLPDEICKAKHLRHLLGAFKWPFRVDNLTNLRTLNFVVVEDQMEFDPMNFINLRELSVYIVGESNVFTLDSIGRLTVLQSFRLYVPYEGSPWFPPLRPLSHCQHLLQLRLSNNRPHWKLPTELHEFLPNLKFLFLNAYAWMAEDPMPILEKLPQLRILELRTYRVNKLVCTARGFPQLQFLNIFICAVEELQVEEGGMPLLKGLTVDGYVRIPERLRSIPAIPWRYSDDWAY